MNAAVLQPLAPDSYRELVRRALAEDVGAGDVTTKATVDATHQARAVLLAKSRCVVAGLDVAAEAFRQLDSAVAIRIDHPTARCVSQAPRSPTFAGVPPRCSRPNGPRSTSYSA